MAKWTPIGALRNRITLQTQPPPEDRESSPTGAALDEWSDVATHWASVEPLSGRQLVNAREIEDDVTHQIRTRYFGPVDPVLSRWTWGTRVFAIVSALDVEERHREMVFTCIERTQ